MASDRRLILTTSQRGLRPLAAGGLKVAASHAKLDAFLRQHLGDAAATLFAEPQPNDADGTIDWYAAAEGPVRRLDELDPALRATVEEKLKARTAEIAALAERLSTSDRSNLRVLGELLRRALRLPEPDSVRVVGEEPVLVDWGHERVAQEGAAVDLVTYVPARAAARPTVEPALPTPPPAAPATVTVAALAPVASRPSLWWLALLLWLIFAGLMAGSYYLLLEACAVSGPGPEDDDNPLLAFCPGRPALAAAPPPELAAEQAREGVLRQRLLDLELQIAEERRACAPASPGTDRTEPAVPPTSPPATPPATPPQTAETPTTPPPDEFEERVEEAGGEKGQAQVTLLWNTRDDLDLIVRCPGGELISFEQKTGCGGGQLDVDANDMSIGTSMRIDKPVENITWPEDAPSGTYTIFVVNQETLGPVDYRIRVSVHGETKEFTGSVRQGDNLLRVGEFQVP